VSQVGNEMEMNGFSAKVRRMCGLSRACNFMKWQKVTNDVLVADVKNLGLTVFIATKQFIDLDILRDCKINLL
jgi:hypothetical protein